MPPKPPTLQVHEVIKTFDIAIPGGPEYRVEIIREAPSRYRLRTWLYEVMQVEVPDFIRAEKTRGKKPYPRTWHPTVLEESGGFPCHPEKRYRTAAAARAAMLKAFRRQFTVAQ
ncbi:MAG TPA: hypothetical protein VD997_09010 [Phycisphaerales bacterium]|nr:hypothetical protein [Phycisphaerales bacterium]